MIASLIIVVGVIIISLIALSIFLKEKHPSLHILYLFSAFSISLLLINVINNAFKDINITPVFFIIIVVFALSFIYYLFIFIKESIENKKEKLREEGLEW